MEVFNVSEVLTKVIADKFIGKKLRRCTSRKEVREDYIVMKRKNGTTNKQFESGDPKYLVPITRSRTIDVIETFQDCNIIDVVFEGNEYDSPDHFILILEGEEYNHRLYMNEVLTEIEENLYKV